SRPAARHLGRAPIERQLSRGYVMKLWATLLTVGVCLGTAPLLAHRTGATSSTRHERAWDSGLDLHDTEEVQRSFTLAGAGPWKLSNDNFTGSIRVAAGDQKSVELSVTKVIAARAPEYLTIARNEVTLDINESPDGLELYVDGPFRCN